MITLPEQCMGDLDFKIKWEPMLKTTESLHWTHQQVKYKIHVVLLEKVALCNILPHCLGVLHKIDGQVEEQYITSYLQVLPRTHTVKVSSEKAAVCTTHQMWRGTTTNWPTDGPRQTTLHPTKIELVMRTHQRDGSRHKKIVQHTLKHQARLQHYHLHAYTCKVRWRVLSWTFFFSWLMMLVTDIPAPYTAYIQSMANDAISSHTTLWREYLNFACPCSAAVKSFAGFWPPIPTVHSAQRSKSKQGVGLSDVLLGLMFPWATGAAAAGWASCCWTAFWLWAAWSKSWLGWSLSEILICLIFSLNVAIIHCFHVLICL
jgi:hypothetical protein